MNHRHWLTLSLIISITTPVYAAKITEKGWYFGGDIGFMFGPNFNNTAVLGEFNDKDITGPLKYRVGLNTGAQIGYKYQNFRIEGQFVYNVSDIDKIYLDGQPVNPNEVQFGGSTDAYAGMLNVFYDFLEFGDQSRPVVVYPYVGAGIGYSLIDTRLRFTDVVPPGIPEHGTTKEIPTKKIHLSNSAFAYQAIAGLGAYIDSRTFIFTDFRFFGTTNINYLNDTYKSYSFNIGVNFVFDGMSGL